MRLLNRKNKKFVERITERYARSCPLLIILFIFASTKAITINKNVVIPKQAGLFRSITIPSKNAKIRAGTVFLKMLI